MTSQLGSKLKKKPSTVLDGKTRGVSPTSKSSTLQLVAALTDHICLVLENDFAIHFIYCNLQDLRATRQTSSGDIKQWVNVTIKEIPHRIYVGSFTLGGTKRTGTSFIHSHNNHLSVLIGYNQCVSKWFQAKLCHHIPLRFLSQIPMKLGKTLT